MKLMVLDHRNRDGWHFDWINEGNFISKINFESGNVLYTILLVCVSIVVAIWKNRFKKIYKL